MLNVFDCPIVYHKISKIKRENLTESAVGCRRCVIVGDLVVIAFVTIESRRTDETAKCFAPFYNTTHLNSLNSVKMFINYV